MVSALELGLRERIEIVPTYWPHAWGTRTVDFDPAFLAANPIGRIPVLVTDDNIAIPESNWICQYLDSLAGEPRLMPQHGAARWHCVRVLAIADGALEAMIARRAESLRTGADRSEDFLAKQRDRARRCMDALESETGALTGDLTLAQISTGIGCGYMDFRYPEDDWRRRCPKLSAWYEEFSQRPSMMQTVPTETPQRPPA